jgi:nucleoside 2-deoxyribosyltransferase
VTRRRLYFAAPLFNDQERQLNQTLTTALERAFEVFLPQRDGVLIPGKSLTASEYGVQSEIVFQSDVAAIRDSDVVFAVLNGRTIDEGVCVELGIAFASGKQCIGYLTDSRVLLPLGINPMIAGTLHKLLESDHDFESWIGETLPGLNVRA